jgi:uncharacterized cupin superfamily protein
MNITILPQTATLQGLESQGPAARPLTQPPAQFSGIDVDLVGAGGNATGIWESTPGRFARHLPNAEVMHILAGSCTFTPTDGTPQDFRAGDTVFFPAHTTGEWHVHETLRKVYVLMAVEPMPA